MISTSARVRFVSMSPQISGTSGRLAPCKNAAAYRTVALEDSEGKKALHTHRPFLRTASKPEGFVFRSRRGGPLMETTTLNQGLHPALKALGLEQGGMHAFRRGY